MSGYQFGLVGYPLGHSYSPRMHQAALEAFDLDGSYSLFTIPPTTEGYRELGVLITRMRRGELRGLNVTIPHKITVVRLLDELSPTARIIGAVNSICPKGGKLVGENFDSPAFVADMSYQLAQAGLGGLLRQPGRRALVLGAGGSARAVVYGLLKEGWQVRLAARRPEQAREVYQLYREFPRLSICRLQDLAKQDLPGTGLVVNATQAGSAPHIATSAWPEQLSFPEGALVYDLVYNPAETYLIAKARRAGVPACHGLGMLARQAALSFQAWTGFLPDWQELQRIVLHQVAC